MQNKKDKDLDERVLKRTLTTPAGVGCDETFFLMIRKSVLYPCMSIWIAGRFLRRHSFNSKLSVKGISDNDYENAQQLWNTMK